MRLELWADLHQILVSIYFKLWKGHFHLLKIIYSLPSRICRGAQNFEDLEQLVDLTLALEQGLSGHNFVENTS